MNRTSTLKMLFLLAGYFALMIEYPPGFINENSLDGCLTLANFIHWAMSIILIVAVCQESYS